VADDWHVVIMGRSGALRSPVFRHRLLLLLLLLLLLASVGVLQVAAASESLRWGPVAGSQEGWLTDAGSLTASGFCLTQPNPEPFSKPCSDVLLIELTMPAACKSGASSRAGGTVGMILLSWLTIEQPVAQLPEVTRHWYSVLGIVLLFWG
jgi:hypothetical protein